TANLEAVPATGYEFVGWYQGGVLVSTNNPYAFAVTANQLFVAQFDEVEPDYVTLTLQANGSGTVFDNTGEDPNTYLPGTWVAVVASSHEGWRFVNWTVGSEEVSTNPALRYQLFEDTVLVANFEENAPGVLTLTVQSNPVGGGTTNVTSVQHTQYQ